MAGLSVQVHPPALIEPSAPPVKSECGIEGNHGSSCEGLEFSCCWICCNSLNLFAIIGSLIDSPSENFSFFLFEYWILCDKYIVSGSSCLYIIFPGSTFFQLFLQPFSNLTLLAFEFAFCDCPTVVKWRNVLSSGIDGKKVYKLVKSADLTTFDSLWARNQLQI